MDELTQEFVVESREGLDELDEEIVALESEISPAAIASAFRVLHSIKGNSGLLGFTKLLKITHLGESLLGRLRDGELEPSATIISTLLELLDATRGILDQIEKEDGEGDEDLSALCGRVEEILERGDASVKPPEARDVPVVVPVDSPPADGEAKAEQLDEQPLSEAESPVREPSSSAQLSDGTIRVDLRGLDGMMAQVGELVLVRNRLLQLVDRYEDPVIKRLDRVTTELQELVMGMRLQPIGHIWRKMPRIVRDLAISYGKQINLEMEGFDTELDKSLLEAIKAPLTHLVRNAIDHGIESPARRAASGKSEEGRVVLRAFHNDGRITIVVADDGAGIDPEHIRRAARNRGLVTTSSLEAMSDHEVLDLIFMPGFSTAKKVTGLSGRGVGMDVVRTNVEQIGGTIVLSSVKGKGATVAITLPLTLAIIPALMVSAARQAFAIPQAGLLELVMLDPTQPEQQIESIHGIPLFRLRGSLLPLVYLDEQLGLHARRTSQEHVVERQTAIVVLQAEGSRFGLVVDRLHDSEEIVVKPLPMRLKELGIYAGVTILGDGEAALILDVRGLAGRARVLSDWDSAQEAPEQQPKSPKVEYLIFSVTEGSRVAIATSSVWRLEQLDADLLESAGDQTVVQYRGQILPLIDLAAILPERRSKPRGDDHRRQWDDETLQVVVCSDGERDLGLVVGRILDVVSANVDVSRPGGRFGVECSAVIDGRVTEILNLSQVVSTMSGATR